MRTLLPFLKPYRKECVFAPLFKLLEAVLELFVPLIMAAIIDNGIQARDTGYVLRMGLGLVGLGLLGFVSSVTAQFFAAKAAVGFAAKLKSALFRHIQGLSYTELDTLGTPTLINRMTTDMNQVQTGVNMTLRLLLRSPFVVIGAMVMAFTVDARAALIFLALIPLLAQCNPGYTHLSPARTIFQVYLELDCFCTEIGVERAKRRRLEGAAAAASERMDEGRQGSGPG